MNKQTARNVMVVFGAWVLSGTLAVLITQVLIPLSNHLTFRGDAGVLIMWVWAGLPEALTAVGATFVVFWLIETTRPHVWVGALAALYLYGGVIGTMRTRIGFQSDPTVLDSVGVVLAEFLPAVACAIAAVWLFQRRRSASATRV